MWYVCYCEPKKALPLARALAEEGVRIECPSFRFRRRLPRRGTEQEIERALIGGMFFCGVDCWPLGEGFCAGVDLASVRRLLWMGEPAVVSDDDLSGLRLAAKARTDDKLELAVGEFVTIDFGPFKGVQGAITRLRKKRATVELADSSAPIEVPTFLLKKNQA